MLTNFFPFLTWGKTITKATIKADLIAGFTGAVIVLPQGVAFATIAGLPPEYGLYTAMITPIIAALFGSSLHLISGPTTAISIVIFATVSGHADPGSPEFIQLALTLTFLAGIYQLFFGIARLGKLVDFVSHTVVIGFTAGAAILIATSQIKHIFGIELPKGSSFLSTWVSVYKQFDSINLYVFAVAMSTLVVAILIKRFLPKIPDLLIALIFGSFVAILIHGNEHGVKLVGQLPGHLPPLSMPSLSFSTIRMLGSDAFSIALLGLIEAVSISRSVAALSNQRIDANQEFIGQGLSNIVGSFFSSYAGSGSFTRSGINFTSGAKTPLSAIFAAFFLALILILIAPVTAYLPVAAMGGVILIVAYKLIDFHHIVHILKHSRPESAIILITFFSTLFLELEFAIYFGVLLSLVLFLARTSTPDIPMLAPDVEDPKGTFIDVEIKPNPQCAQIRTIRIAMPIYFGSLNYIQDKIIKISEKEHVYNIMILCDGIDFIDLSGATMLIAENKRLVNEHGGGLYFVRLKPNVYEFVSKIYFIKEIGNNHFFDSKHAAISTIYEKMDKAACLKCKDKVFFECNNLITAKPTESIA
ncbi:MAG: SulP family inorganic anion transporter [Nitrospirae bacterium]|nr:SulP family inorganic anion transporter [Nitrospirota bacterium]